MANKIQVLQKVKEKLTEANQIIKGNKIVKEHNFNVKMEEPANHPIDLSPVEKNLKIISRMLFDKTGEIVDAIKGIRVGIPELESIKGQVSDILSYLKVLKSEVYRVPLNRITSLLENISDFSLRIEKAIKNIDTKVEFPKTAEDPVAVRLSNGDKFYDAITQVFGPGGGGSVPTVKTTVDGIRGIAAVNPDGSNIGGGLNLGKYDYISVAYPDTVTEIYTFRFGGSGGSLVSTVNVEYTDATKDSLSTVTKT